MNVNFELFDFIKSSPTAFHAVDSVCKILDGNGFIRIFESEDKKLELGRKYYVIRNGSSVVAFKMPKNKFTSYMICASHSDSPTFKIKENPMLADKTYVKLSCEKYGGMLCSTWLDRPLGIAGRVVVKTEGKIKAINYSSDSPCAIIPNVAIHMNRNANDNASYNPAVDMIPLFGECGKTADLYERIAADLAIDKSAIISSDLFLYNCQEPCEWSEFISAPRLDDLQCAYASLKAFIQSEDNDAINMFCMLDNEEVGSLTKQGADSTFICDVMDKICDSFDISKSQQRAKLASSFMISCDNAHAVHPNHPEFSDPNHTAKMNGGIVIKFNANQKYTTDGISCGIFKAICEKAGVPVQYYANRADMPGGSTLGNIMNSHLSLNTVDIGIAQLAMHSSYETTGKDDTEYMIKALKSFYETVLKETSFGIEIK